MPQDKDMIIKKQVHYGAWPQCYCPETQDVPLMDIEETVWRTNWKHAHAYCTKGPEMCQERQNTLSTQKDQTNVDG